MTCGTFWPSKLAPAHPTSVLLRSRRWCNRLQPWAVLEQPLPTFKNWLASRKLNWKPQGTPAGSVWSFDGGDLETHFEGRSEKRAKDVELTGPAATVRSVGRSLEQTPDASIYVVGFGVGPRN